MLFTSEQVSAGHPDKICDQISDIIVTDCLQNDPDSRVAVETMIKDRHVVVAGEITSAHSPDVHELVRRVLAAREPVIQDDFDLTVHISKQSGDIALGVDQKGAGDQGMMFGYACNETHRMLPLPYVLATEAIQYLQQEHHPELLPDAKAQCTFDYRHDRIDTFLISTQHKEEVDPQVVQRICRSIMLKIADAYGLNTNYRALVNPTGRFVTGGSFADSGVTGRKIVADTYGGAAHHGGGAFSGKDPTKVDRSAAYMARRIAKDVLRAGLASRCEIQLAYAIGVAEPVSIQVNTFHSGKAPAAYIVRWIRKHYDLTPEGMICFLGLRDVDYNYTSTLGHFWRQHLPWENTSLPK
jgi:S-adenosylmethionine synthetase